VAIAAGDDPARLAAELRARNPAVLVLVATPRRALPLVEAASRDGWRPARGIVASSDLMSVSFTEDAAPYLDGTPLVVASELDPGDAATRAYADTLHRLSPLRTVGIEGARGYYTGLAVEHAIGASGADASPAALEHALETAFMGWDLGLFRLDWGAGGGGPDRLAFFIPAGGGRFVREGAPVTVG
jgi:ABC-type branched-subunit amino acid transport system substrate-binding protein